MRPLILILLALSFNASTATPPAESLHRMEAAIPDILFINPDGKAARTG
ncbi:MAG: hypothetical protein LJE92_00660 [Gammaproteobacteria bacterium]|nr:hypothetical protein [Gammaproteobacteria bacterium]